jgi:hypothetical protein
MFVSWQDAEKRPPEALPSPFPVSSTGQACCGAHFQVRVVCHFLGLRTSGALHLGIFEHPAKATFFSNRIAACKLMFSNHVIS